jgi:hypothetical protein
MWCARIRVHSSLLSQNLLPTSVTLTNTSLSRTPRYESLTPNRYFHKRGGLVFVSGIAITQIFNFVSHYLIVASLFLAFL